MSTRALFLDRDGVVNVEQGYVWQPQHFILRPETLQLAADVKAMGHHLVLITNQGGIARGLYGWQELHTLHGLMHAAYTAAGATLDAVYVCPHHPEHGLCLCRKPRSLMYERAIARLGLEPQQCLMLGDRARDLSPALGLGMHTVMLTEVAPAIEREGWHAVFENARDAAEYVRAWFGNLVE